MFFYCPYLYSSMKTIWSKWKDNYTPCITTSAHVIARICLFFFVFLMQLSLAHAQVEISHTIYFAGNAGEGRFELDDPLIKQLEKDLIEAGKNSTFVLMGDNLDPVIMNNINANPDHLTSTDAPQLLSFLKNLKNFDGRVLIVPGNEDMLQKSSSGTPSILEQEFLFEGIFDFKDVVIPDNACPGPERKKIGKDIVLLALNSQWWLQNSEELFYLTSDCKNNSREDIINELVDHLDDDDDKQIVIVLHHTLFSNGRYGGHYPPLDHIFPLRIYEPKLWVPLPVVGSFFPFFHKSFGASQDMANPEYESLKRRLLQALQFRSDIIVLSGHEYNFQYFFEGNNHFVNSGSLTTKQNLYGGHKSIFQSDRRSYGKFVMFSDGSINLEISELVDGTVKSHSLKLKPANKKFGKKIKEHEQFDSIIVREASTKFEKNGLHKTLFGKLNRRVWSQPVEHDVFNIADDEYDGLVPVKLGGGKTTKSIRLENNSELQYVLRSVEKKTYKILPEIYHNTFVQDMIEDQVIGATNPYGAMVIPRLADAAGVYHTNPRIVYLPKQQLLGDYNETLGDQLYLFEERPKGDFKSAVFFGNSRKITSFSKMLEKIESSPGHHIHQEQVLKSRLFDMYVGDWDRHDDQWRWAEFREPSHLGGEDWLTYYEPIPRDRDQAFFEYGGIIPNIVKMIIPQLRIWQGFGDDITNMKYFNFSAKHFDRRYLTELEKEDWLRIAREMSLCLTDEAIGEAINQLPPTIKSVKGQELKNDLVLRVPKLEEWADEYYNYLAKYVDVVGSVYPDLFQAERKEHGALEVKIYQFKDDGKLRDLIYQRTFYGHETKEVRLYGLEGDDHFNISGTSSEGPLLRIIGGKGSDHLNDTSELSSSRKSTIVYDGISEKNMEPGNDGLDRRSNKYHDNVYDRYEFYYNQTYGFPFLGYDPDVGLALRYQHTLSTYKFHRKPFGSQHNIGIGYAINTGAIKLDYNARFTDVIKSTDLFVESHISLPERVVNFFGLSNELQDIVITGSDFDFYRYDQFDIQVKAGALFSSPRDAVQLHVGPHYRFIKVGTNEGKFIKDPELSGLSNPNFESSNYIGVGANVKLSKTDSDYYPSTGMIANVAISQNWNLNSSEERFSHLSGTFKLYNLFWTPKSVVLAQQIHAAINFGEFNFHQANYLGLRNGLRGFRNERFGGKSAFVLSNDLRFRLGAIKGSTLPITYGLIGAFDWGRVWNQNEVSSTWHKSYGVGLFFSPLDVIPISLYYIRSSGESSNFLVRLGFSI